MLTYHLWTHLSEGRDLVKPTTPLLSLEAHGTLSDAITFQRRHRQAFARTKPIPTNPRTLPQIYHRWLYQDYASLWHSLTPTQKQQYNTNARRLKITGFNLWMSDHLATLPDIVAGYHLDTISGSYAIDFSKNANNGVVYGAAIAAGIIDHALSFDGIDDYVSAPHIPALDIIHNLTMEYFCKPTGTGQIYQSPVSKGPHPYQNYATYHAMGYQDIGIQAVINGTFQSDWANLPLPLNQWSHVAVQFASGYITFTRNGIDSITHDRTAWGTVLTPNSQPLWLGKSYEHFHGLLDHLTIYNRILSLAELRKHAERRFP